MTTVAVTKVKVTVVVGCDATSPLTGALNPSLGEYAHVVVCEVSACDLGNHGINCGCEDSSDGPSSYSCWVGTEGHECKYAAIGTGNKYSSPNITHVSSEEGDEASALMLHRIIHADTRDTSGVIVMSSYRLLEVDHKSILV